MAGSDYTTVLFGSDGKQMAPEVLRDKNGNTIAFHKIFAELRRGRKGEFQDQLTEGRILFGRFFLTANEMDSDQTVTFFYVEMEGDHYAAIGCYGYWPLLDQDGYPTGDQGFGVSPATGKLFLEWIVPAVELDMKNKVDKKWFEKLKVNVKRVTTNG